MICRGQKKIHTAKCLFAECQKKALGKDVFLPCAKKWHSTKCIFAECQKKALGKDAFCHVPKNSARQNTYLSSVRKRHSVKTYFVECFFLPSIFYLALGKDRICRVPDKIYSAKPLALSKVPVSGSLRTCCVSQGIFS